MASSDPWWGPNVWHHPKIAMIFFSALGVWMASSAPVLVDSGDWPFAVMFTSVPVLVWFVVLRPRLVVLSDEVVVVRWFTTRRYPLAEVVDAEPGYYGARFRLADQRTFTAGTLQRPNFAAWFGLSCRADRATDLVLSAAANCRGEQPPESMIGRSRKGNTQAGFFSGIAVVVGVLFGSGG